MGDRDTDDGTGLLAALRRLDALLAHAAAAATEAYGPDAGADPYRGLVIGPDEVGRLLRRDPGEPLLSADELIGADPATARGRELEWLGRTFELTPFDLDILLIAVAPEIDLRYERLYGFLQDDVNRRRPSVDLALNVLCGSAAARIEARTRVAPDAPLLRHALLHLIVDPNQPHQPLLARAMRADEQVLRFVLGESTLDARLACCAYVTRTCQPLAALPLDPATRRALPLRAVGMASQVPPPRLYFHGPPDAAQLGTAEALAAAAGLPLLVVDLVCAGRSDRPIEEIVRVAFREAWFRGAAIFLTGADTVRGEPAEQLAEELSDSRVLTIVAGRDAWVSRGRGGSNPAGVAVIPFPVPAITTRRERWRQSLDAAGLAVDDRVVEALAGHYRLTASRIDEAVATARNGADWTGTATTPADLFAAARAQSGHDLAVLTRKIEHVYRWDALVLPEDAMGQLRELRDRVAQRQQVLGDWGFDRLLALGKGICALFAGPSGTGKTMAADVVAGELGLDLYKIDLATVVSKYIGETEKNLQRIFDAAQSANAVLFFDEADAIFGKRSEVRDAHDRYANIEIAYLLQKMEEYDGIAILATNLRENLDEAFLRRLQFIVEFPMPDEVHRERMWRKFIPPQAPVDDGIDFTFLARQFRLSGGNIKNIVVSAAYLASTNGGRIGMSHMVRAAWREHKKIGRVLSESDIGDYAAVLDWRA